MSNVPHPILRALNDAGNLALAGAKLYTYETGTVVDKATYPSLTDRDAATNANANPIVFDGNGRTTHQIWLLKDGAYTFKLTDSSDVTIWTEDGIWAHITATDEGAYAESPVDHGGVGDGLSDETAEVQAAIDAAVAASRGGIDLAGLTWLCDSSLDLDSVPDGFFVRNGKLKFTGNTGTEYITAHGVLGTGRALSGDASYKDESVDTTSFSVGSAGSLVALHDTGTYCNQETKGELHVIDTIAGLTHNLNKHVREDYATAASATLSAITAIENLRFENVEFIGSTSASGVNPVFFSGIFCRNLQFIGCKFTGMKLNGIRLGSCYGVRIEGCYFYDGLDYGINILGATEDVDITACRFEQCGGITTNGTFAQGSAVTGIDGGQERNIRWRNCQVNGAGVAAYIDENSQFVLIEDVESVNGGGITAENVDLEIRRFRMTDPVASGIQLLPRCPNETGRHYQVRVTECELRGSAVADIDYADQGFTGGSGALDVLDISRNKVFDGGIDVLVGGAATSVGGDYMDLSDNYVPSGEIEITGGGTSSTWAYLRMRDNVAENINVDGTADYFTQVDVDFNQLDGATETSMIKIDSVPDVQVRGNRCAGDGATLLKGVEIVAADRSVVDGNLIDGVQGVTGIGIQVSAVERLSVASNIVEGAAETQGIQVDDTPDNSAVVIGNQVEAGENAYNVQVDCLAAVVGNTGKSTDASDAADCFAIDLDDFGAVVGNVGYKPDAAGDVISVNVDALAAGAAVGNAANGGASGINWSGTGDEVGAGNNLSAGYTGSHVYTVSNPTEDRTYDANSSTVAELADVLYTLLLDQGYDP